MTAPVRDTLLEEPLRLALWRIFGAGAKPFVERDAFDLVPDVVARVVENAAEVVRASEQIRSWFEDAGAQRWLAPDVHAYVAQALVDGCTDLAPQNAVWSFAAVPAKVVSPLLREAWTSAQIDELVWRASEEASLACDRDNVLSIERGSRISGDFHIPKASLMRGTPMETLSHLHRHGHDLLHYRLHVSLGNLLRLITELRPERLPSLVDSLSHPVAQVFAAQSVARRERRLNHRFVLEWITPAAGDAAIALAILETLNTAKLLASDATVGDALLESHHWCSELRGSREQLEESAHLLVVDMLDRLTSLPPERAVCMIATVLEEAPHHVSARDATAVQEERLVKLESAAIATLERLCDGQWTNVLTSTLLRSLRDSWGSRHVGGLAWHFRQHQRAAAQGLAEAMLQSYQEHTRSELSREHFFVMWDSWQFRDWTAALGVCLALTRSPDDVTRWVIEHASALPLSVWDAESRHASFLAASSAVEHSFVIAWKAFAACNALGMTVAPEITSELAELWWRHSTFAGCRNSLASEYAGRALVWSGALREEQLASFATRPEVGPRVLLRALLQLESMAPLEGDRRLAIGDAFASAFRARGRWPADELHYWGQLWILLDRSSEALQTASALDGSRAMDHGRHFRVLSLQLRCLGGSLTPESQLDEYKRLWPGRYVDPSEREARIRVETALIDWGLLDPG